MTKRAFVLFFFLLPLLVLPLQYAQSTGMTKVELITKSTVILETKCLDSDGPAISEESCTDTPIIQAHEAEWKENLSDLLRHRVSSYRFITFESVASSSFILALGFETVWTYHSAVSYFCRLVTLPDYYSFLHRLCPF
jgi:hypothetical protein